VTANGLQSFVFEVKKLREEIHEIAFQSVAARIMNDQEGEETERKRRKDHNLTVTTLAVEEALRGAWKEFDFKIVPLSSLAQTRAARAKVTSEFADRGAMPYSAVLIEAGFPNYEDLQREAIEEKVKIAQMYQAAGLDPPQPDNQKKKPSSSKK
jgi:hypothetical protein